MTVSDMGNAVGNAKAWTPQERHDLTEKLVQRLTSKLVVYVFSVN